MTAIHPSVRDLAVLQQATQMILSSLDADTVLHQILLITRNYFGASRAAIYLLDENSNELYCRAQNGYDEGVPVQRMAIGKDTIAGWAAFTRAPLYIPDTNQEPRHKVSATGVRSVLALPLTVRERLLGVLEIASNEVNAFGPDLMSLLSLFSGQAAIAIESARMYSADLQRVRQIEIINLIARSAAAAQDTQQFFAMLIDLLSDTFEETMIAIVLLSPEGHLSLAGCVGIPTVGMDQLLASRQRGILAQAFSTRSLAVMNEIKMAEWPACFPPASSELCAPLVSLGEILGAIVLGSSRAKFFTTDRRTMAQAAADVCATAAKNVQLSEELRRIANVDPLTGAYNQRFFHNAVLQEISRCRRHSKEFALLMVDLRDFRRINASLGLAAGDNLLCKVAEVIKSATRNNDVICRYAGDCFALMLPELTSDGLEVVQQKLQKQISAIQVPYAEGPASLAATWAAAQYPSDGSSDLELFRTLSQRIEAGKR